MRDYARVSGKFWTSRTGKDIKKRGSEAVIMALYLMTSPMSNMLGLYYMAIPTAGHETGLGSEGASKGLQCCIQAGFCDYCDETEMVWVFEMAKYQIGGSLKASDLQVKGVQKQYDELSENPFLARFYDRYGEDFKMVSKRGDTPPKASPLEGATKPHASQEQEQAQEQAKAQGTEQGQAQARVRQASAKPAAAPKPPAKSKDKAPSVQVWDAYENAFTAKYGHAPTRNARVNGQLAQFVSRVPAEEAPAIAAFFVSMDKAYYVGKCHSVDCLLSDAEAIRTQWLAGRVVTSTQAQQADRSQANGSVFDRMINEAVKRDGVSPTDGMDDDDGVIDVEAREVKP